MGTPISNALQRIARAEMPMRAAPKPPPAPPPKAADAVAAVDPYQQRYEELLSRVRQAAPPAEGHTRLYRVGEIATNYRPPETVRMYGRDMPYSEYRSIRDAHTKDLIAKGLLVRDTNPRGAAGRWATDAPHELDFYLNENDLDAPVYSFDVPTEDVSRYNVRNTPFSGSSKNHDREFVLPKGQLKKAVRVLSVPAAAGGAGVLSGLAEER